MTAVTAEAAEIETVLEGVVVFHQGDWCAPTTFGVPDSMVQPDPDALWDLYLKAFEGQDEGEPR